jgi:Fe-S cluster assembly protein SufB
MLERRLDAFSQWVKAPLPQWGPDLSELDLEGISYFVDPNVAETDSWDELPEEISETFEALGIPKAEREYLGGVGAQYDSGVVYHRVREHLTKQGVIFENMDVAVQKYPELVKEHFMTKCVPASDHKFTMLHGAVWSGGTFIYVPPGVKVGMPLQAYFRMNREKSGQFEHTLIIADEGSSVEYIEGCSAPRYNFSSLHAGCVELWVKEGARVRYSSIENWSKNTYNLNTKKALVYKNARIEWLNGNMGSHSTMLYPSSVLVGEGAQSESLGVVVAGKGQFQDTGAKSIHLAPKTSSVIRSKSISKDGGVSTYRGYVHVHPQATDARVSVDCDALILDTESISETIPVMINENATTDIAHEATVGRIGDEELFYLASRGLDTESARRLVVSGFLDPMVRALPLEYAIELNKLIDLEMEGSLG